MVTQIKDQTEQAQWKAPTRIGRVQPGIDGPLVCGFCGATENVLEGDWYQRMAEKRAEAQALRKAFHINLPSIEDIGSPDLELPPISVTIEAPTADPGTGELPGDPPAGAPVGEVTSRTEAACPKCSTTLVSFNEADMVCACGATVHFKEGKPSIEGYLSNAELGGKQPGSVKTSAILPDLPPICTDSAPRQSPATKVPTKSQPDLTTEQGMLTWVLSHGKQYTRSWVLDINGLFSDAKLKANPAECAEEIRKLMNW